MINFPLWHFEFQCIFRWIRIQKIQIRWLKYEIEQKGMTFDHDFCYSFSFSSSLFFKEGREKGKIITKLMVKIHAFLLGKNMTDPNPWLRAYPTYSSLCYYKRNCKLTAWVCKLYLSMQCCSITSFTNIYVLTRNEI